MKRMKKQSIIFLAAGILLFAACKKDSDVTPSATASAASISEKKSTGDSSMCDGKGKPKGMPPAPEEIIAKLDTDKDNKISKTEVQGPLAKDFDKVDKNQDGYITLEELKGMCPPKQQQPASN
jgi:hypothetical protein